MRLIVIGFLILSLASISFSISPFCEITKEIGTLPLLPNQTQYVDLLPIFIGYNIDITTDSKDLVEIIDPVEMKAQDTMATPLPNDAIWSVLRPLSDWNGAWQQKAAFVYQTSTKSVLVNIGDITPERNYLFGKDPVQISFENETNCFDAQYIDSEHIVIDCQEVLSSSTVVIVLSNSNPKMFKMQGQIKVTSKKLIKYKSPLQEMRLFSLSIQKNAEIYKSSLSVYVLSQTYDLQEESIIGDSIGESDEPRKYTDIVADNKGNIYLGERDNGIFRFIYSNKTMTNVQLFPLKDSNIGALAITRIDTQYYLDVQINSLIIRFYGFSGMIRQIISYPAEIVPKALHVNQNNLVVETDDAFYFYATNNGLKTYIIKVFQKTQLLLAVEPLTDRALTVVLSLSTLYSLNNGYLIIKALQQTTNITLTFTSYNQSSSKVCPLNIQLMLVNDSRNIVQLKQVSEKMTAESPVLLNFKLDDYFAGSQLKYNTLDAEGVQYTHKHIEPVNIPAPKNNDKVIGNPDIYMTLPVDQNNYLRIVTQNTTIFVEKCTLYNRQVSVAPVTTFNLTTRVTKLKAITTFLLDEYQPIIVYQTQQAPNMVIIEDLKNRYKNVIAIGNAYTKIDDYELTQNYLAIASKALSSLFITIFNSNVTLSVDINFFISRKIEGIELFKPRVVKTIRNSNFLYVININEIIVFSVSEEQVSYITMIKLPEEIDATTQWDIAVTLTNIFVVFADPINKVYNYKIIGPYEIVLLGTVELFFQTIPRPLQMSATNEFIYLQTKQNGVTVIRVDQPAISSNYHYLNLDRPSWFTSTNLFDVITIFELRQVNGEGKDNNLYFPEPSILIQTDTHQKEFKKPYDILINVVGMSGILNLPITLQVFNYQTNIQTKETAHEKLWLPSESNEQIVYLDINNFIGSVTNYQLTCPYCNTDKMKLIQPLDLRTQIPNIQFNDYISLNNGIVWLLTNDTVYYSKDDGTNVEPIKLNTASSCLKFIKINKQHLLLFCQGINSQQFISLTADAEKRPIQTNSYLIDSNFTVANALNSVYLNNWLLILDNNNYGTGNGLIRVWKVGTNQDGSINSISQETTLDRLTFGADKNAPIQGFDILPTNSKSVKLIVCTIDQGIGYGNFEWKAGDFEIYDPQFLNLNNNKQVKNYILDGNKFLQFKYLYSNLNMTQHTILLTVTLGAHLQITLKFKDDYIFDSLVILNSFNKYGSQSVSNILVATSYSATEQNLFIIPYSNTTYGKVTFALYKIPQVSVESTLSIKGAVVSKGLNILPAYLYRNAYKANRFLVSIPKSQGSADSPMYCNYDASQTLRLKLNYRSPGDFDELTVKASNDYSSAVHQVTVDFRTNEGIRWYTVMLMVLGGLTLIGTVFGVWVYSKKRRNQEKKISLVTEDEQV